MRITSGIDNKDSYDSYYSYWGGGGISGWVYNAPRTMGRHDTAEEQLVSY